jgi:hypothetical protein
VSKFLRFGIGLMCLVYASGFAIAQGTQEKAEVAVDTSKAQVEVSQNKPYASPASSPELESLRYKHLWIAYSLIWLIVFLFMYRTYKVGTSNRERLEALKRRLASLENQDG